jgi:hypothetical protein
VDVAVNRDRPGLKIRAVLRHCARNCAPAFETLICPPASRNGGTCNLRPTIKARGFIVGRALEYNFTTLRISRAYVSLLSRPEREATAISLAWIGDYEIRMQAAPSGSAAQQPLFIVDIFDHDAQLSVGSRACHTVAEGAIAFDEFLQMAEPVAGGPH